MSSTLFAVGFVTMAVGLWFIWPAFATAVVGALLMVGGVLVYSNEKTDAPTA